MGNKVRKFKMSWKITAAVIVISVLVSSLVGGISIKKINDYLLEMSKEKTASVAQMAASFLDAELLSSVQPGDEESEEYTETVEMMRSFLVDEDLEYIYTMRKDEDGNVVFAIDADDEEPADIGEEYETYDEIEEAFTGKVAIDSEFTVDEWGTVYTGYAPIFDENGKVAAIVGVDCSVENIENRVAGMRKALIIIELVCFVIAFLFAMLIGKLMAKNVQTINGKMDELANSDGDLTKQLDITSGDEIENVAKSFNAFMDKLREMLLVVKENEEALEGSTNHMNKELAEATGDLDNITQILSDMTASMNDTNDAMADITEITLSVKKLTKELQSQTISGAQNAEKINGNAQLAKETCMDSKTHMRQVMQEMAATVESKIEASKRIEKIIDLTNDIIGISEETQLLALNASIEAARAGEEGKGFAVVADEIGKLADATANTAQEIVDINRFTVEAVAQLVEVSQDMIEFMEMDVNADYETMVDVGAAYGNDSEEFRKQMIQLQKLSNQLEKDMSLIEDSVNRVMAVIEEETASITDVSETAQDIDSKMQMLATDSGVNSEIVDQLGNVIDKFVL